MNTYFFIFLTYFKLLKRNNNIYKTALLINTIILLYYEYGAKISKNAGKKWPNLGENRLIAPETGF